MIHIDDVLAKFKLCEPYFLKTLTLIFIAYLSNNLYAENYVFTVDDVRYRCKDERFVNDSCASLKNASDICTEWAYDNPRSFVAELACQEWKRTLVGSVHNFGYMIGLLIVGPLSDRWGRKKLLVITGVFGGLCGAIRSFVTWYWVYIFFEFLEGVIGDTSSPSFMLVIELVAKERRVLAQMICVNGYIAGSILFAVAASLFPDWRTLLRVLYFPSFLFFIYLFAIDESPRWLLSKGRKDEAIAILEKASLKSKNKIDKDTLNSISFQEQKGLAYLGLLKLTFKSKTLSKRFVICLVWWTASTFVSFGISVNSVYLQGNKYLNYSIIALLPLSANIWIIFYLDRYKRKSALLVCFVLSALFFIIQPFVPTGLPWLSILLFIFGKIISSTYFEITYIFTSEIFPTYTRNSMHALCSSLGRIGSIIAPQTPLLIKYWHGLPSLLFGVVSLLAGIVTLFAPDTAQEELPDTVRQAEELGQKQISSMNNYRRKTPPGNVLESTEMVEVAATCRENKGTFTR